MVKFIAGILFFLLSTANPAPHEYYVSIFDCEFNSSTESLEMSIKIFTDDLEKSIEEWDGNDLKIPLGEPEKAISDRIEGYLADHITLLANGRPLTPNWVGMEVELDESWIYLEFPVGEFPATIEVNNRCLLHAFDTQLNIMHLNIGDESTTFLLRKGENVGSASFHP